MALSLKQKAMLQELEDNFCNVSDACKIVGICRDTHYKYMKQNRQYSTSYDNIRESLLDTVESTAYSMAEIEPSMVQFILKTKGKSRGYSEKVQIEHSGQITEIVETIILPDEA